jgi:hypothetical protein
MSSNITRAMGLVPVNARTVTSVMGLGPTIEDEFVISRVANRQGKTSDIRNFDEHRGNLLS